MKKLLLLIFLLISVTLNAQVNTDTIVPTCQIEDTTKSIYVTYSVILFETTDSIILNSVTIKDDAVIPYTMVSFDPVTYEAKNLCVLGLRDGDFILDRFGFTEEFAKYLLQIHKSIYPNVYILKSYSER